MKQWLSKPELRKFVTSIDFAGNTNMGKDDDVMESLFQAISDMSLLTLDLSRSGYSPHCL